VGGTAAGGKYDGHDGRQREHKPIPAPLHPPNNALRLRFPLVDAPRARPPPRLEHPVLLIRRGFIAADCRAPMEIVSQVRHRHLRLGECSQQLCSGLQSLWVTGPRVRCPPTRLPRGEHMRPRFGCIRRVPYRQPFRAHPVALNAGGVRRRLSGGMAIAQR
jgi:hypothetical protein